MSAPSLQAACSRCGAALPHDAAYCPSCGRKRDETASTYSLREKVALTLFGLVVLYSYYMLASAIAHRIEIQSGSASATILFTGLLASGIARKRRVLSFFLGCALAVPLMFIAGVLGGALRGH